MARSTQALKTGMQVLGGKNVPAFTLEYLTPTQRKKVGEYETIVVPYIELGRSSKSGVRFSDGPNEGMVSGTHAAIAREGSDVVIRHLSQTNETLVNGRPVQQQWFLNNGDEIQLANGGPKLRYNAAPSGTASMGFTRRMNLVVQQAVRPYRTAVAAIITLLVAITGAGGYFLYQGAIEREQLEAKNEQTLENLKVVEATSQAERDSLEAKYQRELAQLSGKYEKQISGMVSANAQLRQKVDKLNTTIGELKTAGGVGSSVKAVYQRYKNDIYFIQVASFKMTTPEGKVYDMTGKIGWTGTGFMLSNNSFVTARHVIQGWRFINPQRLAPGEKGMLVANMVEALGGKLDVQFQAISPDQQRSFSFTATDTKFDDAEDRMVEIVLENGEAAPLKIASLNDKDWAYVSVRSGQSDLGYDGPKSGRMEAGDRVIILGYSYGASLQDRQRPDPLVSESTVAQDGLKGGVINLTDRNFGTGNSGGPVLYVSPDGQEKVIGIVSAGLGDEIGIIVPIGALK